VDNDLSGKGKKSMQGKRICLKIKEEYIKSSGETQSD
jgi:hypothetical protein